MDVNFLKIVICFIFIYRNSRCEIYHGNANLYNLLEMIVMLN